MTFPLTEPVESARVRETIEKALERRAEREAKRIRVEVTPTGTVTLTGEIRLWAEKRATLAAARFAPGVRSVEDQLEIDPWRCTTPPQAWSLMGWPMRRRYVRWPLGPIRLAVSARAEQGEPALTTGRSAEAIAMVNRPIDALQARRDRAGREQRTRRDGQRQRPGQTARAR
jgi:BON domain